MQKPQPLDWLVLAALVVAWGSAFAALKIAVEDIPPAWNTAGRLWVAAATLLLVGWATRTPLPRLSDPAAPYYIAVGVVGMALPFILFAHAAERLPSAVNAICNGASPIFTALLAYAALPGEQPTARKAGGVALGFAGIVALTWPRLAEGLSLEALALAAALGGAFLYAIANILTRKAPPMWSGAGALVMCLAGALTATAFAGLTEPLPAEAPGWESVAAVTVLGVFATALASIGYVFLVKRQGPLFMTMSVYLAPLWATGLGVALLGERPDLTAYLALALILAGVALATGFSRARAG